MENIAQKITAFATILALPFALGAFILTWAPAQQFYLSDPRGDVAKVRGLFLDFQKNLYLPHTEYQRVS